MIECSVVVPAYNAAADLPRCLTALGRQSVPSEAYEVIVVDDGSTDDTPRVAQSVGVRVIRSPHAGPAAARNAGARAAHGNLVLFTDADCEPAPDWIAQLARPFDDAEVAGAKGAYRSNQSSLVARFVQQEYQDKYDRMAGKSSIDFVDTYSAAYRRQVFLNGGGFDARYTTASVEDQELSFRLAAQGHRLVFAPRAVVGHRHDRTLGEYFRRKLGIGYWKALLLRRHPDKIVRDSHTPQVVKLQMALGSLAAASAMVGLALPAVWGVSLGALGLLLLSALPLLAKIARRDPAVLAVAPLLVLIRALALTLGLAAGAARFGLRSPQAGA